MGARPPPLAQSPPAKPHLGFMEQVWRDGMGSFRFNARMSFCAAICPLCDRENECQFATTSAYKGKCWCASENFSPDLLTRIPDEARNVVCVCRRCVVAANFAEAKARPLPRPMAGDFYIEGEHVVFTAEYHRRRGYCCGSGCRHCPFDPLEREVGAQGSLTD